MFPVRPAKAEPLFPVWLENAYRISLKPCGPGLSGPAVPSGSTLAIAVKPRMLAPEHERDEHRHLDLEGLDLLAEVLGRPADHQAGDEHGQDRADDEHPVHPGADRRPG